MKHVASFPCRETFSIRGKGEELFRKELPDRQAKRQLTLLCESNANTAESAGEYTVFFQEPTNF